MVHRILVGKKGGEVEHNLRTFQKHALQLYFVQNVSLREQHALAGRNIPTMAGGEIIKYHHSCAQTHQLAGEVGSDGPGAAGDQHSLARITFKVIVHLRLSSAKTK